MSKTCGARLMLHDMVRIAIHDARWTLQGLEEAPTGQQRKMVERAIAAVGECLEPAFGDSEQALWRLVEANRGVSSATRKVRTDHRKVFDAVGVLCVIVSRPELDIEGFVRVMDELVHLVSETLVHEEDAILPVVDEILADAATEQVA